MALQSEHGQGVSHGYNKAFIWYNRAFNNGNQAAQFNIGVLYYYSRGVHQDYTTSLSWFLKSVENNQGGSDALNYIGSIYSIEKKIFFSYGMV